MTTQSHRHGLFRPALLRSMASSSGGVGGGGGGSGEFERSHSLDGGSPAGAEAGAQSEANRIIASRSRRGW